MVKFYFLRFEGPKHAINNPNRWSLINVTNYNSGRFFVTTESTLEVPQSICFFQTFSQKILKSIFYYFFSKFRFFDHFASLLNW